MIKITQEVLKIKGVMVIEPTIEDREFCWPFFFMLLQLLESSKHMMIFFFFLLVELLYAFEELFVVVYFATFWNTSFDGKKILAPLSYLFIY